jgi:hypothetical protein
MSWGNAGRFGERAESRPVAAAASGATPGDCPGRPFPGGMRAGKASGDQGGST